MDILVYKWTSYTIHFHKRSYHRLSEKYFQIKSDIEIMRSWTILWGLTVVITVFCSVSGKEFCYNDDEGCGPNTDAWSGTCRNGTRQSPIDLPSTQNASGYGIISLQLKNYRGSFFRIRNSGHTLVVDFVGESGQNEGPSAKILRFPDPLKVTPYSNGQVREYKLSSAHFHWGTKGSEHCINKVCSAMELHLVHYLAKYKSPTEALDSKDPNALAVIGVLIDTNPKKREASIDTTSALAPIIKNLDKVLEPTENQYTVVNESLDLTPLLVTESPVHIYSYKGSLTTPECNEQVNWYVTRKPATVPKQEVDAFRTMMKDSHGQVLNENHRPLQSRNNRAVMLSKVL